MVLETTKIKREMNDESGENKLELPEAGLR